MVLAKLTSASVSELGCCVNVDRSMSDIYCILLKAGVLSDNHHTLMMTANVLV